MGIFWAHTGAVGCIVIMSLLRVRVLVFYFLFCKLTEHNLRSYVILVTCLLILLQYEVNLDTLRRHRKKVNEFCKQPSILLSWNVPAETRAYIHQTRCRVWYSESHPHTLSSKPNKQTSSAHLAITESVDCACREGMILHLVWMLFGMAIPSLVRRLSTHISPWIVESLGTKLGHPYILLYFLEMLYLILTSIFFHF